MKNSLIVFIFSTITFFSCKQTIDCDLIITNANILKVETGNILKNKSIVINKGKTLFQVLKTTKPYKI
jgi:hypothetical protein